MVWGREGSWEGGRVRNEGLKDGEVEDEKGGK